MLEIGLIIVLSLIFFIVLRKMPAKEEIVEAEKRKEILAIEEKRRKEILRTQKREEELENIKRGDIKKIEKKILNYIEERKLGKAERMLIKLAAYFPKKGEYLALLGEVYFRRKNYQDAAESYLEAIKREPENGFHYFNLGEVYYKLKEYKKAVAAFKKSLSFNNKIAKRHAGLGNSLLKLGRYKQAEKSLQSALQLEPNNEAYKDAINRLRMELKSRTRSK